MIRSPLTSVVRQWHDLSLRHKVFVPYVVLALLVGVPSAALASALITSGVGDLTLMVAARASLGICIAAVLLIPAVGLIVTRSITGPIGSLMQTASDVASGHLDSRAPTRTSDEIGLLSASFNEIIESLVDRTGRFERLSEETFLALAAAIDARDPYTYGHSMRVAAYSSALARMARLADEEADAVQRGCLVHDIGKIAVPDTILRKTGRLTRDERAVMREHPVVGYRMVSGLDWSSEIFDVVLHHHERWDGMGYPTGLKADAIPLMARVVAIADTLDAMTSRRPYRAALSFQEAVDEIIEQAGSQFDPALVRIFRKGRREIGLMAQKLNRKIAA